MALQFHIITLFPEMIEAVLNYGVIGRAAEQQKISVDCVNPRTFTHDKHQTVDDKPYGGGPGMLMRVQPLSDAIDACRQVQQAKGLQSRVVYLSPQGKMFNQNLARENVRQSREDNTAYVLIAGRYEGIDERLIEQYVDEEWSIGDYVLSGGELAAAVVIDAMSRLVPGVLGDDESAQQDSFMNGLLDHPHYTRPEEINGRAVPTVLLSGDHAAINRWREKQSLGRTWLRRPELLESMVLSDEQKSLLDEFKIEFKQSEQADKKS